MPLARWLALASVVLPVACGVDDGAPAPGLPREAGFLVVPPRDVTVHGSALRVGAEARLFYDFVPATHAPEERPIFVLSNGFSARIVRAYGTGPVTVALDGTTQPNPSSLASFANLVWIDPRQSGFSYDVVAGRSPSVALDCGTSVFDEYVDAADVLLATLAFLRAHPALHGPVVWVGESYAAVRLQWILAFVRDRWDLAPYDDPTLRGQLAATPNRARLRSGQILLQPWLVGRSQTNAIADLDRDAEMVAAIEAELGASCEGAGLSACVKAHGRSPYDVRRTAAEQATREWNAALAHVDPARAQALLGVPLEGLVGLRDRKRGFKCNAPDDETPSDAALVARFGALGAGQSYFIPHSPLQPDKALDRTPLDWWTTDLVGYAFADALLDVPTFVTDGKLDLIAPARALPSALGAVVGRGSAVRTANAIEVVLDGGAKRTIAVGTYPNAGHMITIDEAPAFARDVEQWTNANVAP